MNLTDILKDEHRGIKKILEVIGAINLAIDKGEPVELDHLVQIIDFIRGFADGCHHAKEEKVLFPALEAAGFPRDRGPVGVMLMEHELGRKFLRAMDEAVTTYQSQAGDALRRFSINARGYAKLLYGHIDKEDSILFPMAEETLTAETKQAALAEFEKIEIEDMGEGVHEKYHELIHELTSLYLVEDSLSAAGH